MGRMRLPKDLSHKEDEWVDLFPGMNGYTAQIVPEQYAAILQSMRFHYQAAIDAAREWRVAEDAIERAANDEVQKRIDKKNSLVLRDLTDRRNFHWGMHRMISDQLQAEIMYQQMVERSRGIFRGRP